MSEWRAFHAELCRLERLEAGFCALYGDSRGFKREGVCENLLRLESGRARRLRDRSAAAAGSGGRGARVRVLREGGSEEWV